MDLWSVTLHVNFCAFKSEEPQLFDFAAVMAATASRGAVWVPAAMALRTT